MSEETILLIMCGVLFTGFWAMYWQLQAALRSNYALIESLNKHTMEFVRLMAAAREREARQREVVRSMPRRAGGLGD